MRRHSDGELCGFIDHRDGHWVALTVFGAILGSHDRRDDASRHVLEDGLASLAERWTLRNAATGEEEVVCIREINTQTVTLTLGYYSLPGVPTLTLTTAQLASGDWELRR